MITTPLTLVAVTDESLEVDVFCTVDPTGDRPEFALCPIGAYPTSSTTWTPGTWATTWGQVADGVGTDDRAGWVTARTPLISSVLALAAGDHRWLFARFAAGSETPIMHVGALRGV